MKSEGEDFSRGIRTCKGLVGGTVLIIHHITNASFSRLLLPHGMWSFLYNTWGVARTRLLQVGETGTKWRGQSDPGRCVAVCSGGGRGCCSCFRKFRRCYVFSLSFSAPSSSVASCFQHGPQPCAGASGKWCGGGSGVGVVNERLCSTSQAERRSRRR